MTRFVRIRNMQLGELAELLNDMALSPWCQFRDNCAQDLEHGRDIPEERCRGCAIAWLLSED